MTVQTDLRTYHGIHRRLFLAIDGLKPLFWQRGAIDPPNDWSRSVKTCLRAPEESSMEIDLADMLPSWSGITFELDDIVESDGSSYFGKLFGPSAWQYSNHARLQESNTYHTYIDANATTIPVNTTLGMANGGNAFIGQESINYVSTNATHFINVTKGLYPCIDLDGNFGHTYCYVARPLAA